MWDRRSHQSDETGKNDEGNLHSFARAFFEYFEFSKEMETTNNTARINLQRILRENRSVIGKQAVLFTGDNIILNPIPAAPGRVRIPGKISGEVTINEIVHGVDSDNNTTVSEGQNNRVTAAMLPTL